MYDIVIIGAGPAGYVGAIRAAQLGFKTAVIEKSHLGGICLNYGCIPTKALLKSTSLILSISEANKFGIEVTGVNIDFSKIVQRSRQVAMQVSKGVELLLKKNNVDILWGEAKILDKKTIQIKNNDEIRQIEAKNIVIATGARPKQLPNITIDGTKIISYKEALTLQNRPASMLVIGSGAIGTELAFFYASVGTEVHLVELLPNVLPTADSDISNELLNLLKRSKIKVYTSSTVQKIDFKGDKCVSNVKSGENTLTIETDIVLSAVGVTPNTENLGLENVDIKTTKGFIEVDEFYQTSVKNIYAVGDVIQTPALAHVASAEAIICIEKIAGLNPKPIDYNTIPAAVYTEPEIASVGLTEIQAREKGFDIKIGKFPFSALGKATAIGQRQGFVKLIFDKYTDKLVGAHIFGHGASDLISELVVAMNSGTSSHTLLKSVHPHPTMSEAIMEAAAAANNEAIHI